MSRSVRRKARGPLVALVATTVLFVAVGVAQATTTIAPSLTVLDTDTDQSGSPFRAKLANAAGSAHSRAARLTVSPRAQVPAGGIEVTDATLDWLGNEEMQGVPYFGGSNYFSAGLSAGTEATYRAVEGDAAIWQVSAAGEEAPATWATRAAHVAGGGRQVARLSDGEGRVEADGSADIRWQASFSVNFYGGLVPFTISDPELRIDPAGSGRLTATLEGCASSQSEPDRCVPLTPAAEVVVANFDDATVEPGTPLVIEPLYAGVTVEVPAGSGSAPQRREGPSWGAWPQSFVDFQLQTGLSSYWYSSGTGDDRKPPLPFSVHLEGPAGPGPEPPADGGEPGDGGAPGDGGGSDGGRPAGGGAAAGGGADARAPGAAPAPGHRSGPKAGRHSRPARLKVGKRVRLDRRGRARIAVLACPKGGAACRTIVPARVATRIDGRRRLIAVHAPRKVRPGRAAPVTIALAKAARRALGDHRLTLRVRLAVRSGSRTTRRIARVTIVGRRAVAARAGHRARR